MKCVRFCVIAVAVITALAHPLKVQAASRADIDRLTSYAVILGRAIACGIDTVHASYDGEYANRFWRILVQTDSVLKEFRGRFLGKCTGLHLFWGNFDIAVTRFSGRRAPERPELDRVMREAYSHECISGGS